MGTRISGRERIRKIEEFHLDLDELEVIPEAFLWRAIGRRAFPKLVAACIFSRDGTGRQMSAGPGWRSILPQDLQHGNIILRPSKNNHVVPLSDHWFQYFVSEFMKNAEHFKKRTIIANAPAKTAPLPGGS